MAKLGEVLRYKTKTKGMTYENLSRAVGISIGGISNIFSGITKETNDNTIRIVKYLDLTESEIKEISQKIDDEGLERVKRPRKPKPKLPSTLQARVETYDRYGNTVLGKKEYNLVKNLLGKHTTSPSKENKNNVYVFNAKRKRLHKKAI